MASHLPPSSLLPSIMEQLCFFLAYPQRHLKPRLMAYALLGFLSKLMGDQ